MIDQKLKIHFLNKILSSQGFYKTNRYKELLGYLVQAESEGKSVKETSIAIDLFKKDDSFDPAEDTIVRVTVLNLRKKLAHYYFTDGVGDSVRLEIPKGTYDIVFSQVKPSQKISWNKRRKYLFGFQVLLLLFFIIGSVYLFTENRNLKSQFHPVEQDNPIWSDFINTEVPNILVLGDYFFMYEMHNNRRIFVRDARVNSIQDFEEKIRPDNRNLNPLEYTYSPPSAAISSSEIGRVLNMRTEKYQTKLASELEWDDFNQANIIYTGQYKSLFLINQLLPQFHFQYKIDSTYMLYRTDNAGEVLESYEISRVQMGAFITDYSFISKIKGPGNNAVLLIASGDEVGLSQSIDLILSADFQDDIETKFDGISFNEPFYFEMILKTEGFSHTGFSSEIVYFKESSEPE